MAARGNTEALGSALREAFATHIVDDRRALANYSLRLSDDPKVFHTLYRGACVVMTSPDPARVVAALVRHLDAHGPTPARLVPVQAVAVIRDGRATLLPTLLEDDLRTQSRQLDRAGAQILDTHTVLLDLEAREVVVQPRLAVDRSALEQAVELAPAPRRPDPPVPDGRYPIERWLLMELWQPPGPYSRATATRRAALVVRGGVPVAGLDLLDRLADVFKVVEAEGIDPGSRQEILTALRVRR